MRIVFMGTSEFGIPMLRILSEHYDVAAVITRHDTSKGRGRKLLPTPVKVAAREMGIPVLESDLLTDPVFISNLKEFGADLFFVAAFRILPKEVYTLPPKGTVNLHASLLPDYRGAAPINWAIINGDKVTGLTTFFIEEKVDTGDIIQTIRMTIGPNETAGELGERMKVIGADLALITIDSIEKGTLTRMKQSAVSCRPAPKLFKKDGRIDWQKDAQSIHNLVRGINPAPGAFTDWIRGPLKIHRTEIVETESPGTPGYVEESSPHDGIVVSCGKGKLRLCEVQPPGKNRMDGPSFVRGYRIERGISLHRQSS